jgi:hypothetical protein
MVIKCQPWVTHVRILVYCSWYPFKNIKWVLKINNNQRAGMWEKSWLYFNNILNFIFFLLQAASEDDWCQEQADI